MILLVALALAAIAWWAWQNTQRKTHSVPPGLALSIELPHQKEFELYHNALSLCSMKSRVCLAELGIAYKSHPIDLIETGAYENIRRAFLKINPAGTVPVLVHNGHPVYESHEQIRYAADHAPPGSPVLVPEDETERREMQRWIDRSSLTGDPLRQGDQSAANAVPPLTVPLFAAMIERIPWWKIFEGLLFHIDKRRPVVFASLKLFGLGRLPQLAPAQKLMERSRRQLGIHLDALEEQLQARGGPWILGERFSLADVSWLVIFERLVQVDGLTRFVGRDSRPLCAAYWEQLQKRPSYREAILEQSHPYIEYGTRRIQEAKAASPALRRALEGSLA